jgi:class 3 adenylate cyclase
VSDASTQFAKSDRGSIAYQVVGDGPVEILVCRPTSFPLDLMWEEPSFARFLTGLASFSRSIWLDPLGTGSSDAAEEVEGRLSESHIGSMLSVLDEVGIERAVVLGLAPPALQFAATHPTRTEALILFNVIARMRWAEDYPEGTPNEFLDRFGESAVENPTVEGIGRLYSTPSLAGNARYERWRQRCARLSATPTHRRWRLRATIDMDSRAVLPAIRVPTLVIRRGGSAAARSQRIYVAEHIAGARDLALPGEDDLFFAGDPGPLLDAIQDFVSGDLPTQATDRVLATVMFTDVVGSTDHVVREGDRRWRELLSIHDHVVRAEIQRFRGIEVKTVGDGFLVTFDGPGRALQCAAAIRDAVRSLGLDMRIGLHTGEIELHGDDIAGVAVHIAQRVQSCALPGEIVVSRTVVDLVAGSGIVFTDRGTHTLKGIPQQWRIYALEL